MRWQRWARLAVGLFLIAFTGVLYYAIRERQPAAEAPPGRVDLAAATETAGGVWTFSNGETVEFGRLLSYEDGRVKAHEVTLQIPEAESGAVTITAREAEQQRVETGGALGLVDMRGNVEIRTDDGLRVLTDEARYSAPERTVRALGAVSFDRGRLRGSGLGATYDCARDRLWLLNDAQVAFEPDASGSGAFDVAAGGAGFARSEQRIYFERGVHMEREGRLIDTLDAVITLDEDDSRIKVVELRGDAHVSRREGAAARAGKLSSLRSRDMDLRYGADGITLETATLVGGARLDIANEGTTAPRQIAAERLDLTLAPDGTTLAELVGRERVQVTLPSGAGTPARRVTAATLDATGDDGGLTSARFTGAVEYREMPLATRRTARAAERVARSSGLELTLQGGFGTVREAVFRGDVTFTDGTWRGEGTVARYIPATASLVLSTDSAQTMAPQVADGRITIGAREIELQLTEKALEATGSVQSTMNPRRRGARSGERLPALLSEDEAAYVVASTLSYDGDALVAAYGGGARLWQGDTLVQGERLTLDGVTGDLAASGGVRTVLALVDPDNAELSSRTTAEAAELEYDEDGRRITCIGKARLRGPEGDVQAERIVLELTESGRELARADAMEGVEALLEVKYFITGSHLTYQAPDGRYIVEGVPVRIVEEGPSGCFETTGAVLTFLRSTATIDVDGTDASRSRTRQVPCPERRR